MPLSKGTSNRVRQRNIAEMIASGHDPRQSVAAAYREQRASKAKASHRRSKMPESASHAPGHEISGEGGATRQRHRMGEGGAPMGGNFGVMPLHEANRTGGPMHGEHVPHDGVHLGDHERANGPNIEMGKHMMTATRHSHHGLHQHKHTEVPNGKRPHHVG